MGAAVSLPKPKNIELLSCYESDQINQTFDFIVVINNYKVLSSVKRSLDYR